MKKLILSLLLISGLFLVGCNILNPIISPTPNPESNNESNETELVEIDVIKNKVDAMSLDEKIGQMVVVGFDGYTMNDNINSLIKDNKVGGVILFSKNVENSNQLAALANSIKTSNAQNKTPLFISVDEEGGRVSRMPPEIKKLPSNKVIGKRNDGDFSYNIGKIIGEELKTFGFNMDFAPVLDINSNPDNPVIGDRSFGNNVDVVNNLGIKTMKGIMDSKIISVVKHFPGHGDTSVDSHIGLPVVNKTLTQLNNFELLPFKEAIKNNVDAIMVSHILLSKLDVDFPASMSKVLINDVLRQDLKFQGVIITDDMTMGAIIKNYDIGDASVKSVNAGSDLILVCHGFDNELKVINSLKAAVQNKIITEDRLNESVYRILKLKEKYIINNDAVNPPNIDELNNKIEEIH
ncbi:beta-N-acetylhexosaminidase [Clostridium sp. CS001]|uniref:beta-N-acetylhexosaminidase n=1 Tax=Clostridium sp. CS001 TaxID=2880648 RepID=UPI001CF25B87|nr:beta-N-acetylhexosaminidase [Clostridium sp. CS001]MCB2288246.1 beta-N-acetylhexosaminidase [Clostridium sp. CS001]